MTTHQQTVAAVRQAYRYVATYQKRLVDLLRRLDGALAVSGFQLAHFEPDDYYVHKGKLPHEQNEATQALLPLLGFEAAWFTGESAPNASDGQAHVILRYVADTSLPLSADFSTPESVKPRPDAETLLRFAITKQMGRFSTSEWECFWDKLLAVHFEVSEKEVFPSEPRALGLLKEHDGSVLHVASISLAELDGPDAFNRLILHGVVRTAESVA